MEEGRLVQLDCSRVAEWVYACIFAVEVRFQIRDQFWIPQLKLHGECDLQNILFALLLVFLSSIERVVSRGF